MSLIGGCEPEHIDFELHRISITVLFAHSVVPLTFPLFSIIFRRAFLGGREGLWVNVASPIPPPLLRIETILEQDPGYAIVVDVDGSRTKALRPTREGRLQRLYRGISMQNSRYLAESVLA